MKHNLKWIPLALVLALLTACSAKPTKQVPAEFKKGQDQFHKVCANCHGPDALGGETKAPNLIHARYMPPEFTDEDIRDAIVNGSTSGKMPSQRTSYSDDEITEIIKYLRYSQKEAGLRAEVEEEEEEEEEDEEDE